MHYFIFTSKDTYITENSSGTVVHHPNSIDKNYGGDEILELKKEFSDEFSSSPFNTSRLLTQFDYSDISSSMVSGEITGPKFYLRYYEVEGQQVLDKTYSLSTHPLSQSWDEGVGKHFDNPKTKNGISWSGSLWLKGGGAGYSGSRTTGGGLWLTGSAYETAQTFTNQSSDIEMDVTKIVNKHLGGSNQIDNHGFLLKFSGSIEGEVTSHNLKFFSKQTHTVYQPKLEVRWDDHLPCTGSNTGSLTECINKYGYSSI